MPSTQTDRLDGLTTSVAVKAPCKAASTANLTLSGLQTVNGVALAEGDRVLVKDQTDQTTNGIYTASSTTWQRALDFDGTRDVVTGTLVIVVSASGQGSMYRVTTTDNPIVFGTSDITFVLSTFGDASGVNYIQLGTGAVSRSVQDRLREVISVKDFGATGDGVTDDTTAIQNALNAGRTIFFPDGDYVAVGLAPLGNTNILLADGGRIIGKTGSPNFIFSLSNAILDSSTLTGATSGAGSCTVSDGSKFQPNDRVIISGGTFTGSGSEEGPIEFNTVTSVVGNTLNLSTPLQLPYTGFGLPASAPRVARLGPVSSIVRNVRITGGRLAAQATASCLCFGLTNVENITIEGVRVQDDIGAGYHAIGTGIMTGHNISRLIYRGNIHTGAATGGAPGSNVGINVASIVESIIESNIFSIDSESATNVQQYNHLILEVTCRDNSVSNNIFGPIRTTNSAAIEFTFYSFGNRIIGNKIWGVDADIQASVVTMGIRTLATINAAFTGNVILGNTIQNIMLGIGDGQNGSVIVGNTVSNQSLNAASIGIMTAGDAILSPMVGNTFASLQYNIRTNTGVEGGSIHDGSNTDPVHGGIGSIYQRKGATLPGHGFWTCQPNTAAAPVWYPVNQVPSIQFGGLTTSYSNGTMLYVVDGTTGSHPLSSGGSGTMAVRTQNAWQAFP